ncbi:hypothetical protein LCGC14_1647190 [marine sediment metagenome]|uniref:Uncharacterized protein n=1 Tax=marine sediment metagenome TaxID=412755 RepID=A0A0F9IKE3_9ZZZZ
MGYISYSSGERLLCPDGQIRTVAFTGNGGWVHFYYDEAPDRLKKSTGKPAPIYHSSDLQSVG